MIKGGVCLGLTGVLRGLKSLEVVMHHRKTLWPGSVPDAADMAERVQRAFLLEALAKRMKKTRRHEGIMNGRHDYDNESEGSSGGPPTVRTLTYSTASRASTQLTRYAHISATRKTSPHQTRPPTLILPDPPISLPATRPTTQLLSLQHHLSTSPNRHSHDLRNPPTKPSHRPFAPTSLRPSLHLPRNQHTHTPRPRHHKRPTNPSPHTLRTLRHSLLPAIHRRQPHRQRKPNLSGYPAGVAGSGTGGSEAVREGV